MKRPSVMLVATVLAIGLARAAASAEPEPPTAADFKRLETEIARVQQQVTEQRQLILQLMQMHDALLRYLQASGSGGAPTDALPPTPERIPAPASGARAPAARTTTPSVVPAGPSSETGSVSGHVSVNGAAPAEAYVYLDGPRAVPAHPPTIEIKQENRKFKPAVAVVPVGARVLFPNRDTVFHNVFSNTPGDAFDVGTLKAGQIPEPIALLKPGQVEIFCNIHSKMRADVLVVPNVHWARVRADGTFQLAGLPAGSRRIVVWGPGIKPVSQQVDVKAAGTTATFSTEERAGAPHLNKNGGAYGSYEN